MKKLAELVVYYRDTPRPIGLYLGDLTRIPEREAVDILVVSAFRDDYLPTPDSLIGGLDDLGVSVEELARDKDIDLRDSSACWLSRDLGSDFPDLPFRRILCFEPGFKGDPPEVVSDIFQSLASTVLVGPHEMSVAMPLVATGDQMWPASAMFLPLLEAAVLWLERGLPLSALKIVERSEDKAAELSRIMSRFTARYEPATRARSADKGHATGDREIDAVISYAHADSVFADQVVAELESIRPDLAIFVDRPALKPGAVWLEKIFNAIDRCEKVVVLLSPRYLRSRYCRDEFLAAMIRENDNDESVLFPLYLLTVQDLPSIYKIRQFHDCREGNEVAIRSASRELVQAISP